MPAQPHQITQNTRIGWIGTGVMGASMCGHLLRRGHVVSVFTRSKSKAKPLIDAGAVWAETAAEVTSMSDVIFTMVGFPIDVDGVYFNDEGILAAAGPGQILVDMTTTEPTLAMRIHDAANAKGAFAVDAPVSGGDVGAREARLSIMAGGDRNAFDAVRPLFETLGKSVVYQGGPGAGQHTKMCNQIVIAGAMIGMCEALVYGRRAGLDLETMLSSIRGGAAGCWSLENYAPRILKRDFAAGFLVEHFIKDMAIALQESQRMGLALPGLALVHQLYIAVQAAGHGRSGTQALIIALERMSNLPTSEQ